MLDYDKLWRLADEKRSSYLDAKPFPWAVFDHFLPYDPLDILCEFFPQDDATWKRIKNPHTHNRTVIGSTPTGKIWEPEVEEVFNELMSARFLQFMERLTGITGLISDPYYAEAGFYAMREGGYLDIHADFSHHDKLGLERRCNLLIYLNDNWKPEYKGDLVLYDRELKEAQRIAPLINRAVIFEASQTSYHGNPEPLQAPIRKAVSMWYYTLPTGRPKHRAIFPLDPTFVHMPTT